MVYKSGLIGVVKVGGKIMREQNGEIHLPFGSEYSILLKNKESRKAVVTVEIDGQDVLGGKQIIIASNQDVELMGFLEGQVAKNKFKFIQKTKEIADYRGDRIDDGVIRIGFKYEVPIENRTIVHENHYYPLVNSRWIYPYPIYPTPIYPTTPWISYGSTNTSMTNNNVSCSTNMCNVPAQEEGITVKGSEVNQNFNYGYAGQLEEQERTIIIILKGYAENGSVVKEPVTVALKYDCSTCGKKHSYAAKFCSNCGTFLS